MVFRLILLCILVLGLRAQSEREIVNDVVSSAEVFNILPTGSMKPTLDERYLLLVKRQDFKTLCIGDIIVWAAPKWYIWGDGLPHTYIVHRVWDISSGGSIVLTKGDNVRFPDTLLITQEMYVGTVVGIIRKPLIEH